MKPTEFLSESTNQEAYATEDEQLDGMALGELKAIAQAAEKIYNSVKSGTPLEAWMYKKITNGNEGLTAVAQQINNPEIREPQHHTLESAPDYSDMFEGTIYDMDKEYGAPAPKHKPRPHMAPQHPRHPDDPDFMDPDQRRLRADQARVKKAQDEYHAKKGVAEGHADQQRKIFKKNGHPVGEVGIDRESSPGNGQWYMKYYPTGDDFGGYDSMEEAVADLKHLVNQFKAEGVAEKITPPGKDDMEQYRKDTADMAKAAIANKTPMSKNQVNEFAGGMGASSVATAPGVGKGPKIGSLFGGSYAPKTPFNKKRKR